ncbi:MAG: lytic murein transglycosylase [Candidatus Cloacimonadales bacterium]|jgi:membrane-bound lytic murein transglycosylase B|nr:lytic murein transglycosylase [Candidatus Cloacimonadota bacterium]MDD2651370.1 lytic murein transglycosylase [Candidatus Cloacimonadota bacterium]MDD3502200.1 lytic murein transglycosylase [Candidatus Cloacimonadota bacterium]MDX9977574.1 lytic murein transglycosylase [Candidatus Cloacimonadales bacterium]
MKRIVLLICISTIHLIAFAGNINSIKYNQAHNNYQKLLGMAIESALADSLDFYLNNVDFETLQDLETQDNAKERLSQYFAISEDLIQKEINLRYRSYYQIPSQTYPLFDEENRAIKTIEIYLLIDAWQAILQDKKDEALTIMEKFFSIRRLRWTNNWGFLMPYEQNEEIRLGYAAFQAYELLNQLLNKSENLNKNDRSFLAKYLDETNPIDYLYELIYTSFTENTISFETMTQQSLKLSGMLQCLIFAEFDWKSDNLARRDLWYVLNDQMALSDSTRNAYVAEVKDSGLYQECISQIKRQNSSYLNQYNELYEAYNDNNNFEFNISFTGKYSESFALTSPFYTSEDGKIQLINVQQNYQLTNDFFTLNLSAPYIVKKAQNGLITISWKSADNYSLHFEDGNIELHSDTYNFLSNHANEISYKPNSLQISLAKASNYQTSPEWWDYLDQLKEKLSLRGVPEEWFESQVNHENFKVYLNMKRLFTRMPEHRAKRGEISTSDYLKNFGVEQKAKKAAPFINQYKSTLEKAEQRNGIHYEIILAILAIESDYGNPRQKGNFYTFPALVSQYMLLPWRERFAINELVALYEFSNYISKDSYHFIGSFAGAAGWGQFIPTSMKAYFIDSNDKPSDVDIYSIEDNIVSIENYLYKNGLSNKNIDNYKSRYNAVYSYNHSDYYVKAVLHIYDNLRSQRKKK